MIIKTCLACAREFQVISPNQRYCLLCGGKEQRVVRKKRKNHDNFNRIYPQLVAIKEAKKKEKEQYCNYFNTRFAEVVAVQAARREV